jgi:hypothetical protein
MKHLVKITSLPVMDVDNFAHHSWNGRTGQARSALLKSLSKSQREWLQVRPWRASIVRDKIVIYARMGKYMPFEHEELIACMLFPRENM